MTATINNAHQAYDVFLRGKEIDTVFYSASLNESAEDVKRSLVNHDGYDPSIVVVKRKPSR